MHRYLLAATASLFAASAADAAVVVVTPGSGWQAEAGANNTGTAAITGTQGRNGNGSIELRGDRSRFYTGGSGNNLNGYLAPVIVSLSQVTSLTFDWRVAGDSTSALDSRYTPALRLIVRLGAAGSVTSTVRELIWEGAYNGTYDNQNQKDVWYTSGASDKFYTSGGTGNGNDGVSLAQWAIDRAAWDVVGISVGQGSSVGAGYHAFADNVTLTTTGGTTTYNFEASAVAAVPEPATWAMLLIGFGGAGVALRRRRTAVHFA